jgi:hypothetical protein
MGPDSVGLYWLLPVGLVSWPATFPSLTTRTFPSLISVSTGHSRFHRNDISLVRNITGKNLRIIPYIWKPWNTYDVAMTHL